jgi:hypothetical protein
MPLSQGCMLQHNGWRLRLPTDSFSCRCCSLAVIQDPTRIPTPKNTTQHERVASVWHTRGHALGTPDNHSKHNHKQANTKHKH